LQSSASHCLKHGRCIQDVKNLWFAVVYRARWAWGYRAGGRRRRKSPQFVVQTKPVGQYSLHSRAILAYYKNKWDKFCGKFCQFLWEICYLIGIFRNHSSPSPRRQQFWKVSPEVFLTTRAQSEKVGQTFFPPP
jgi:hypothetical protein